MFGCFSVQVFRAQKALAPELKNTFVESRAPSYPRSTFQSLGINVSQTSGVDSWLIVNSPYGLVQDELRLEVWHS